MTVRGNKPVGTTARIMMALSAVLIVLAIVFGVRTVRTQQAFPARGTAALPAQAAEAGAQSGEGTATR